MSGYKRFVSYIFSYENGVKKENVGYARIENYNEQCRINIYMKDAVKRDQKASVYLFYRDEGKIQGIFMKEITIKNGFGDCKIITESENIGGTSCSFENVGGIIIYVTANRFWGTEWDDKPIYGFEPEKKPQQLQKKSGLVDEKGQNKLKEWEQPSEKQEGWQKEEEEKQEEQQLMAAVLQENSREQQSVVPANLEEPGELERRWQEIRDETKEEMRQEEKRYFEEKSDCDGSERDCFEPYTKIYPFYEQNRECIGIAPKDLTKISPILEQWQHNDFLLHGYGRFRHIILLRKKGEEEYFIGVPGMYRPSEEKLAVTYGFSLFVPMKKQKAEYGDFGYWCTMVKIS